MATIAEQLTSLANTKSAIKDAIVAKGVAVADDVPFSGYPTKIGEISGGGTPATKFGVSIDNILGNVDVDGAYVPPTEQPHYVFTGVKRVNGYAFQGAFAYRANFIAEFPDLTYVESHGFEDGFLGTMNATVIFSGLTELTSGAAFLGSFSSGNTVSRIDMFNLVFPALKRIATTDGGLNTFASAFNMRDSYSMDSVFPVLEEISTPGAFSNLPTSYMADITFSKIKKIVGVDSLSGILTFKPSGSGKRYLRLPSAIDVTGYITKPYNTSSTFTLHFAAANQAAIEACSGYEYLFGASEIYFDLMLNITVNGTVYNREHTIDGYTSWKDSNGNLVYTNTTAEPAVGTTVYTDQGTTQIGTVSEVA